MPPRLSTTSFAILGLLAVRPGTAYDLAKRMERNYRFIWPSAQSKLYEEVKRLVELGLASAKAGSTGRRPKTEYRVTAKGRRALSGWVTTPGAGPSVSFEGLVKILYADFGSRQDLLAQLASLQREADQMVELGVVISRAAIDEPAGTAQRSHTQGLVARYLWEHYRALSAWARWATDEVSSWDGTGPSPDSVRRARAMFAQIVAASTEP